MHGPRVPPRSVSLLPPRPGIPRQETNPRILKTPSASSTPTTPKKPPASTPKHFPTAPSAQSTAHPPITPEAANKATSSPSQSAASPASVSPTPSSTARPSLFRSLPKTKPRPTAAGTRSSTTAAKKASASPNHHSQPIYRFLRAAHIPTGTNIPHVLTVGIIVMVAVMSPVP